ncbi:hypothetical protein PCANC_20292 [Puccinia coronata f. sp. avenae]|uniref:GRIP domain-containing protein n=1 Tax=Puccinia coronata f. sp. avenae TaxID=200324 RepID=A0A2N5UMH9_9BASI|nr:hypothetical protein PCANC_20292 [Puccinia coronata f. sp. avenae]
MAENIPLPDSPPPAPATVISDHQHRTTETPIQQSEQPHSPDTPPQKTATESAELALNAIIHALLPIVSGQNTLLDLRQTLQELSQKPYTTLTDPTQQLFNYLTERQDQLERWKVCDTSRPADSINQLNPDQPPPDPPDKTSVEDAQDHKANNEALKVELDTTLAKLKQEEEKRAKSISLLRAVRQKLVQTEKDKNALESELNEMNSSSTCKIKELQTEKRTLEDELSKLRIFQEQQLSKLRHSYERENQSIKSQFEREAASKKSQFELDTITAKAAYERELSNRNQRIAQAEGRLRDLTLERDRLFEQLQKSQAELEDTTAQHDEIKGSMGELQHQLTESHNRIQILSAELNQLQKSSSSQDKHESGLQTVIQELENQHLAKTKALELRISQLEKERLDVENELGESLRERLAQIETLRAQSHLKSLEYADSLKSMAQRNEEIEKSDAEICVLKSQLESAQKARDSQANLIANLTQQLEELQAQLKIQVSELESLKEEISECTKREQELRIENKTLRENEIKKVDEVKGLFLRGNIGQNQRQEGVGYFASFARKASSSSLPPSKPFVPTTTTNTGMPTTTTTTPTLSEHGDHQIPDEHHPPPNPHRPDNHHEAHQEQEDAHQSSRSVKSNATHSPSAADPQIPVAQKGNGMPTPSLFGEDDEAELNFEYLRNTLLQFLEHKEMRPHLVRVLGVILHFTPQEIRRLASKV